jgi:hypothetical protein
VPEIFCSFLPKKERRGRDEERGDGGRRGPETKKKEFGGFVRGAGPPRRERTCKRFWVKTVQTLPISDVRGFMLCMIIGFRKVPKSKDHYLKHTIYPLMTVCLQGFMPGWSEGAGVTSELHIQGCRDNIKRSVLPR